jgi:hypothetical protein
MSDYTPAQLAEYAIRITGSDLFDAVDTDSEAAVIERIEALQAKFDGLKANALRAIVAAYNDDATLCRSSDNEDLREATMAEAYDSAIGSYEGHFVVRGEVTARDVQCYVQF